MMTNDNNNLTTQEKVDLIAPLILLEVLREEKRNLLQEKEDLAQRKENLTEENKRLQIEGALLRMTLQALQDKQKQLAEEEPVPFISCLIL